MSVVVVAVINPKPGHRDEVRSALRDAVAATHKEEGCELYSLHENSETFVMVERWASQAALEAHSAGPVLQVLGPVLEAFVESTQIHVLSPVAAGDPAKSTV